MQFMHMIFKYLFTTQEKTRRFSTTIRKATIVYCRDHRVTQIGSIEEHAAVSSFQAFGMYNRANVPDFGISPLSS
jgi:hypothetical protein